MTTSARVVLWGRDIGAVSWDETQGYADFEYTPAFIKANIPVAPIMMPPARTVYSFPELAKTDAFKGLPGMLADSLPDTYGNAVIDEWLASKGRPPGSIDPVERLRYMGKRAMGALEFKPALERSRDRKSKEIMVDKLSEIADEVLNNRKAFRARLDADDDISQILQISTSAGGQRAKAIVAWSAKTNEIRSGQVKAPEGFTYWILKIDGVNRDLDDGLVTLDDPAGYGLIELAYYKLALKAGIEMNECRVFEQGDRRHFMTKRFDRTDDYRKIHMQSLAALLHLDYQQKSSHSYEQAFNLLSKLGLGMRETEQLFRRMVFNIVGRNQDDHVKNIAFLMDRNSKWRLAPAYDMTYSYKSTGWTAFHQMSMNGKREEFETEDFYKCGERFSIPKSKIREILDETQGSVSCWSDTARELGVSEKRIAQIKMTHRYFKI